MALITRGSCAPRTLYHCYFEYCQLRYYGKCFRSEIHCDGIGSDYARDICESQGGKMADIYSENHYYMLMGYMRTFSGLVDECMLGFGYGL